MSIKHREMTTRSGFAKHFIPILAALSTATLIFVIAPKPFGLHFHSHGNPDLAHRVEAQLHTGYRHHVAAVETTTSGSTSYAGWGADQHSEFEIGSLTKTFTAAAFADAIKRGEVRSSTSLAHVFRQLKGTAAGNVTLGQLATQHSGLPRLLPDPSTSVRALLRLDPYHVDTAELLAQTARITPERRTYGYSNLGFSLLGQAVAKSAGMPYPKLIEHRLLRPLGLRETSVPTRPADLAADAPRGRTASGLPSAAWTQRAQAPAGSMRSTTHDLAIWLAAVHSGEAPGADAAQPRAKADRGNHIGYAWMRTARGVTWHNGGTGGFASLAAFRDDGHMVAVLSDTTSSVDDVIRILGS